MAPRKKKLFLLPLRVMFWGVFICLSIHMTAVFMITLKLMSNNFNVGIQSDQRKELLNVGKDLDHILETKKSQIFKDFIFNDLGLLVDITLKVMIWAWSKEEEFMVHFGKHPETKYF